MVGDDQESAVRAAITSMIGHEFHVHATDASHGNTSISKEQKGAPVYLLLTGPLPARAARAKQRTVDDA